MFLHVAMLTLPHSRTVKTGRWGGVVTAFITMSDIKDEIDWEFPGEKTTEGQSNFFWQGVIRKPTSAAQRSSLLTCHCSREDRW